MTKLELLAKAKAHIRQMAPHIRKREQTQILIAVVAELEAYMRIESMAELEGLLTECRKWELTPEELAELDRG